MWCLLSYLLVELVRTLFENLMHQGIVKPFQGSCKFIEERKGNPEKIPEIQLILFPPSSGFLKFDFCWNQRLTSDSTAEGEWKVIVVIVPCQWSKLAQKLDCSIPGSVFSAFNGLEMETLSWGRWNAPSPKSYIYQLYSICNAWLYLYHRSNSEKERVKLSVVNSPHIVKPLPCGCTRFWGTTKKFLCFSVIDL